MAMAPLPRCFTAFGGGTNMGVIFACRAIPKTRLARELCFRWERLWKKRQKVRFFLLSLSLPAQN
jgi:hypothetical protein